MDFSYVTADDPEEWNEWAGRNFEVRNGAVALGTNSTINATSLGFDALDIGVDRDENIYALRPSGDVYRYRRDREFATAVWTNEGEERIEDPTAIALAGDRIYIADRATGDLVVVSEESGEVVGRIDAELADPLSVVRGNRKLYILDGGPPESNGRLAALRRATTVETVIRGLESPRDMAVDSAGNIYVLDSEDGDPVISIYDAGHVESPNVFPYRRTIDEFEVNESGTSFAPTCIEALADSELVLQGTLSTSGKDVIYHYNLDEEGPSAFDRRQGFDRACSTLLVGPQGGGRHPTYYAITGGDNIVHLLDVTTEYTQNPISSLYRAQAFRRFDAGESDTEWHRVTLDFDRLPASTRVVVNYYASNRERQIEEGLQALNGVGPSTEESFQEVGVESVWDLLELDPATIADLVDTASVRDGAEWIQQAISLVEEHGEDHWKTVDSSSPEDALLEEAVGRYLHVKLELTGEVSTSPRIERFRAYCPRLTYLRYLPAIFQQNGARTEGTGFLGRYLAIFESAYVDTEEDIETITRYFDPDGVPNEYLSWLGSWLAIEFDESWPEGAKREFLVRAPELFKKRGTKEGMREILKLYLKHVETPNTTWMSEWQKDRIDKRVTDEQITEERAEQHKAGIDRLASEDSQDHLLFFFEHLDLDGMENVDARRPYTMHMSGSQSFVAFVGPFIRRNHSDAAERIVLNERPAHTAGNLVEIRQHFKLEGNTFLGINSTLTPREFILGRATLGGDTMLEERERLV